MLMWYLVSVLNTAVKIENRFVSQQFFLFTLRRASRHGSFYESTSYDKIITSKRAKMKP